MPRSRYRVLDEQYPHFITATAIKWLPIFTRPEVMDIVLDSWRFLQKDSDFKLYGYVILENHLHLVAASKYLTNDVHRFKAYTAKEILSCLRKLRANGLLSLMNKYKRPHKSESDYQVWEEGGHPQMIESEAVLWQKLDYIHQNPIKRGYVDLVEHWRYSSARNYSVMEGVIDICMEW